MKREFACFLLFLLLLLTACDGERSREMSALLDRADSLNRAYVPMTGGLDSLLRDAADYYDRHGTSNEQMRAHYLLGRSYYDCEKLTDALEAFQAAAVAADTTSADCNYHTLSLVHTQMADIFHRHYQPRTAIAELIEARRCAYKDRDTIMAIECYFDLSNEYERLGQSDSAFIIAAEAARLFAVMGQNDRAAAAKSATVLMLLDQHRTDEARVAIETYLTSSYIDSLGNVAPGREIFYYKHGLYYLQVGKTDSAEYLFRKELRDGHDINNQIAARKGLQLLYEKIGNADSVAKYAAEGYNMSDSVYIISESQNIQSLQALFDYSYQKLITEQKNSELKNTRFYLIIAIMSLLLIIVIVVYLVQRRAKQYSIAETNYQATIKELSLEERLVNSPISVHLQRLSYANPPRIAGAEDIKALKALINSNIPSFFDTANPRQLPLNEQELVVCILTRLAFPSVNIDRLTGVSEGYTSRLKSRIYKKLTGIDGNAKEFEHWIKAIK